MNISSSNERPSSTPRCGKNIFNFFGSAEYNASASDAGNLLLVIATLIATVTFQIGVNPPGGVWQDAKDGHKAGTAIYAPLNLNETELLKMGITWQMNERRKASYFVFLLCNTLTLSTSVVVMLSLTSKFPLRIPIRLAIVGMMATYMSSIFIVTPNEYITETLYVFFGLVPFIIWGLGWLLNRFFA